VRAGGVRHPVRLPHKIIQSCLTLFSAHACKGKKIKKLIAIAYVNDDKQIPRLTPSFSGAPICPRLTIANAANVNPPAARMNLIMFFTAEERHSSSFFEYL